MFNKGLKISISSGESNSSRKLKLITPKKAQIPEHFLQLLDVISWDIIEAVQLMCN